MWTPGNSRGLHPTSWMEMPDLADAVSFLIQELLSSGIPPGRLAKALRHGVSLFGSFAAAIGEVSDPETREQLSPTELLESDLESEQASDAEGSTAVVSHTLRRANFVYTCFQCGIKFAYDRNISRRCKQYCCSGCRKSRGKEHKHGLGAATSTCHRALPDVGNVPPLDAGWSRAAIDTSLR